MEKYGLNDYIGDLFLKRGINNRYLVETLPNNFSEIIQKPFVFVILTFIQLIVTIIWLRNPWPFPHDTVTKHAGAIEIFIMLYCVVSMLYFSFFRLKEQNATSKINSAIKDLQQQAGIYYSSNSSKLMSGLAAKIYSVIVGVIIFVLAIIGLFILIRRFDILYHLLTFVTIILISIFGMTLVYFILKKMFNKIHIKTDGILQFIWKLFLFIPCLTAVLIQWLLNLETGTKIDGTPDPFFARKSLVWIVLLIETCLIALYLVLPYIFNKIVTHDGNILLNDPVYLNKQLVLGKYEDLNGKITPKNEIHYKYKYSISAWIYINPQPPSTSSAYNRFTPLLSYGKKPAIEYNGKTNEIRVITESNTNKNGNTQIVTLSSSKNIQYQKWNNYVINYDGANMDVFINGELVGTKPNIAPYMQYDDVISGHPNGIHGGICNVIYYDYVKSKSDIALTYRTLRDKEFPILK